MTEGYHEEQRQGILSRGYVTGELKHRYGRPYCTIAAEVLTMSLHNGDKARSNRQRRARLKMREKVRDIKKSLGASPEKKQKGK